MVSLVSSLFFKSDTMKLGTFIRRLKSLHKETSVLLNDYDKPRLLNKPCLPNNVSKIDYLFKVQKGKCPYCNKKLNKSDISKEHIIPKSLGGCNHIGNLCLVHKKCNNKRGNDMNNEKFIKLVHKRLTTEWWKV